MVTDLIVEWMEWNQKVCEVINITVILPLPLSFTIED